MVICPEAIKAQNSMAAEHCFAPTRFNLGIMYAEGEGVPLDYVLAHMWLSLANSQGSENPTSAFVYVARKMTQAQLAEAQKLAREWKPK